MEQILNSYNIFVDSSHAVSSNSQGDNFHINLQDAGVHAGEGQIIRLTLNNFSMNKTWFDVNATNSSFVVKTNLNPSGVEYNLTHQNLTDLTELAENFQGAVLNAINDQSAIKGATFGSVNPASGFKPSIISFGITTFPSDITSVEILFPTTSDIYQLLGGDRSNTNASVNAVINGAELNVECLYPAQMTTCPYVYIRCPGTSNTNLETRNMGGVHDVENFDNKTEQSYILGRAAVDVFFVQFASLIDRDFTLDLKQQQLNSLKIQLTDSKNRPLGRLNKNSLTASGIGTKQSTLGNLEFTAVIRVDIIQKRNPVHLHTEHYEPSFPARFSNLLSKQGHGKNEYNASPGY